MTQPRGRQTAEFVERLTRNRRKLPAVLVRLADRMYERVQAVEEPGPEEIQSLLQGLSRMLSSRAELRQVCGEEGEWCGRCPFGVFIPSEFELSSETQPVCLPWIAVTRHGPAE